MRSINTAGLALIEQFEGLKFEAYLCPAGVWTIGYGHTRGVHPGMVMTKEQAQQALQDDLLTAEGAVESAVGDAATTDNRFAAMVSLCYNIGAANFRTSTVLRDHRAGNYPAAGEAFLSWNKIAKGGVLQPSLGLTNRRNAERALYMS